jgi:anti-sigma regulatory factor (Ser/Thr protein kinase)
VEEAAGPDLGVGRDTDAWAEHALDLLAALDGVRRAGLGVVEGGGRRLSFVSAEDAGAGLPPWCHVDAYDDVPLNTVVRSGRAVVGSLDQLEASHPVFVERQRDTGTVALAAVPIVDGRRTLGGFVLFYRELRPFGTEEVEQLSALGAELGRGLRRAQEPPTPHADRWVPAEPSAGARVVQFSVAGDPAAVGPARHELRDALRDWDLDPDAIDRATLCLSELVTNAVVHAASGSWVRVTNDAGSVAVTVRSPGAPLPGLDHGVDDPLQVHGRGLQLVEALSSSWGSEVQGGGLTTWFVLDP